MGLITEAMLLGSSAFFFREGVAFTVPSAGTCAAEAKPGAADPVWISLGPVTAAEVAEAAGEAVEQWAPLPGRLRRKNIFRTKEKIDLDLTVNEVTPLALQAIFRTEALAGATNEVANPLEGGTLRGWLKLQLYDQADTLRFALDQWCELRVNGAASIDPGKLLEVKFSASGLHSSHNQLTIA